MSYEFQEQMLRNLVVSARRRILRGVARMTSSPLVKTGPIMLIVPHPDDEVLGCGGLIAGYANAGEKIEILFLTRGSASHQGCCNMHKNEIADHRKRLSEKADEILGVPQKQLQFLNEPDGKLPRKNQEGFTDLAAKIAACLIKSAPKAVFCPHPFEGWSDHIAATELTVAAIDKLPRRPKLYYYCVWFWYSMPLKRLWRINWRQARLLDIKAQLPFKKQAMRICLDALAPCGNPWVGKLPKEFLGGVDWNKELYFETDQ